MLRDRSDAWRAMLRLAAVAAAACVATTGCGIKGPLKRADAPAATAPAAAATSPAPSEDGDKPRTR
jgi:predicted small lipoprotein YifL